MLNKRKLEKLATEIEKIVIRELEKNNISYRKINIAVYPFKTVGIQGDERTYAHPAELEIISIERNKIYKECLEKIASRIPNEIKEINRVLYTLKTK